MIVIMIVASYKNLFIEDDNELEWDVEDFDVFEYKIVKRILKVNKEV